MNKTAFAISILPLLALVSCSTTPAQKAKEEIVAKSAVRGQLQGQARGEVIFTQAPEGSGVKMMVDAAGLKKQGIHAMHIHEKPVCLGDFTSAGGHYDPHKDLHGHPEEREHHVGDLGNFRADPSGAIIASKTFDGLSMDPTDPNYVGNKALIIHAKADDYSTQPTGGAGARIGCAVLQNTAE